MYVFVCIYVLMCVCFYVYVCVCRYICVWVCLCGEHHRVRPPVVCGEKGLCSNIGQQSANLRVMEGKDEQREGKAGKKRRAPGRC